MANNGIIAASAVGIVVVIGAALYFLAPGIFTGIGAPPANGGDDNNNTTTVASPSRPPGMLLVLLQGPEDASMPVAQYQANNTEPIPLASNAHIRFESPDYRTAESIRAIARDLESGEIQLLRKSYDVNNEFFINVGKGPYELHVQASWSDRGSFVYRFGITVV